MSSSLITLSHVQTLLKSTFILLLCLSYLLRRLLPLSFPYLILITLIPASILLFHHHHYHHRRRKSYLLDFSCYLPPSTHKCNLQLGEHFVRTTNRYSTQSIDFMRSIFLKSGLGPDTYLPPFFFRDNNNNGPTQPTLDWALIEAQEGMFTVIDQLLTKTNLTPSQIGYLVVTCGSFSPDPSLTSLLINRYKFRHDIKEYNLSGMGCSSGVLAIDLAAKLVTSSTGGDGGSSWWNRRRRQRNDVNDVNDDDDSRMKYALVVITENMSLNWYFGDNRSMLVTNCIFRVGCAAAIITSDHLNQAKFELVDSLRTHHGSDDSSYRAAFQEEDENGNTGVSLTKDLIRVAGTNLRIHIRTLAPRVLPITQLLTYFINSLLILLDTKPTKIPDFTSAFDHICIHTGGKAVIEQVSKVLRLESYVTEPARMTLHRFGNTSSSMVLYELAYFEAKGRVKKGDRLWMLGFGTGFKVGSLVWRALRDVECDERDNPWRDSIHMFLAD